MLAGAQDQGDSHNQQIFAFRKVDLVVDSDPGASDRDQAKHHDRHTSHHGQWNGLDQRALMARHAQANGVADCGLVRHRRVV